jgi:predicted DNA-binding WGR domain protein
MKVLVYMGPNPRNTSGVSWKMWKIHRRGREVTVWWGRATIARHKLKPAFNLQSRTWRFRTEEGAREDQQRRIQKKLSRGYEPMPKGQGR